MNTNNDFTEFAAALTAAQREFHATPREVHYHRGSKVSKWRFRFLNGGFELRAYCSVEDEHLCFVWGVAVIVAQQARFGPNMDKQMVGVIKTSSYEFALFFYEQRQSHSPILFTSSRSDVQHDVAHFTMFPTRTTTGTQGGFSVERLLNTSIWDHNRNDIISKYIADGGKSLVSQYLKIDPAIDPMVKLAEDVMILIYSITSASSSLGRYIAIVNYAKLRNRDINLVLLIAQLADDVFSLKCTNTNGPEIQGAEEILSQMRMCLDGVEEIGESPMYKKLSKFGMYVLANDLFPVLGLSFEKFDYSELEAAAIKRKHKLNGTFLYHLVDMLVFLAEKGIQCYKLGRLDPLIHNTKAYQQWYDKAMELKRNSQFTSNPEVVPGFKLQQFLADLDESLAQAEAISKMVSKNSSFEKKMVTTLIADLQLIKIKELSRRMAQKERKAPFAVLLAGDSSIGKSSLTKILYYHYAKLFDLPSDPEFKYTRLGSEKHWTNFATYAWCIQMDDIAFLKPNSGEPDPTLMEMLSVNNNVPFTPEQASLEDKGRTPVRAEFLIATTNTEHLNLGAYFSCPYAVARRFPCVIVPKVKPEYSTNGELDSSKIPSTPEGEYPDLWTFTIKKPIKGGDGKTSHPHSLLEIEKFDNIYDLIRWFSQQALRHADVQRRVIESDDAMPSIEVCKVCYIPMNRCYCVRDEAFRQQRIRQANALLQSRGVVQSGSSFELGSCYTSLKNVVTKFDNSCRDLGWSIKCNYSKIVCLDCQRGYAHYCSYLNTDCEGELDTYDAKAIDDELINNVNAITRFKLWVVKQIFWICTFPLFLTLVEWYYPINWKYCIMKKFFAKDHHAHVLLFRMMAHRVERSLNIPLFITKFVLLSGSLLLLLKTYNWFCPGVQKEEKEDCEGFKEVEVTVKTYKVLSGVNEQGLTESIGATPEPEVLPNKPYYFHDPYVVSDIDVNPCAMATTHQELVKRIEGNLAKFEMSLEPRGTPGRHKKINAALNVGGCVWMVNYHSLPGTRFYLDVILGPVNSSVTPNLCKILVTTSMMICYPEYDLAFIEVKNIVPKKKMVDYFVSSQFRASLDATMVSREKDGTIVKRDIKAVRAEYTHMTELDLTLHVWRGKTTEPTKKGDCGSVLVSKSGVSAILGIHLFGEDDQVGSIFVPREVVQKALDSFTSGSVQSGEVQKSTPSVQKNLLPVHHKSPLRFTEGGTAVVYGTLDGFRATHKSRVEPSLLAPYLEKHGYAKKFDKPPMNWQPWYTALSNMTRPVTELDQNVLTEVTISFIQDILGSLDKKSMDKLMVYDNCTAINGAPGVQYVDKINRNTSASYPYNTSKRKFMFQLPEDERRSPDDVEVCQEVMDRVDEMVSYYHNGTLCHPIFQGNLKDEPKPPGKMTRTMFGSGLAATIVCRKYMLSFIKCVQENTFIFEAGPGTVAQSLEWERMREYLAQHPLDRIVAGDYTAYDQRMSSVIILKAFEIIERVCAASGNFTENDLRVIRGVGYDTAFPTINFNGDLLTFYGTNPSGHSLTVIINSLVNSLYMRYAYAILGGSPCTFKRDVALMTYGDDNIMSVSPKCDFFNHTAIQEVLAKVDIPYTMAEKGAESRPFITLDEASFLKRTWRWDPDVNAYLAPLEHKSIEKMLTSRVASKTISPPAQAIAVIGSAIREYFFYGKKTFESRSLVLKEVVKEAELEAYVESSTFPTWDELYEQFWSNSLHVELTQRKVTNPMAERETSSGDGLIGPSMKTTDC